MKKKRIKISLPDKMLLYAQSYDLAKRQNKRVWDVYKEMKKFCIKYAEKTFEEISVNKNEIRMTIYKTDDTSFEISLRRKGLL
jgi:hypothetical protein